LLSFVDKASAGEQTDLDGGGSWGAVDERQLAEACAVTDRSNVRLIDKYLQLTRRAAVNHSLGNCLQAPQ